MEAAALKRAYRAKVFEFHPDRNPGSETAERMCKDVIAGYEILSDARKKAEYDRARGGDARAAQDFAKTQKEAYEYAEGVFSGLSEKQLERVSFVAKSIGQDRVINNNLRVAEQILARHPEWLPESVRLDYEALSTITKGSRTDGEVTQHYMKAGAGERERFVQDIGALAALGRQLATPALPGDAAQGPVAEEDQEGRNFVRKLVERALLRMAEGAVKTDEYKFKNIKGPLAAVDTRRIGDEMRDDDRQSLQGALGKHSGAARKPAMAAIPILP